MAESSTLDRPIAAAALAPKIEALQSELPFKLTPTNLAGAFTPPPFPDNLDPHTASSKDLMKNGFMLRRPVAGQDPQELVAAWNRVFSRKWLAKDFIAPQLAPQPGRVHRMRGAVKASNTSYNGNAWGGGVIAGNWISAFGSWTIPTVSKPTEAQGTEGGWNSASWVGIDGANTNDGKFSSNDVLQAGVEQRVDARGNASYTAWFEWFAPTQGKTVLGDTSPLTPALASLNGRLYIAWKGDGNDQLNVMVSTDNGVTFHNKFVSGETSPRAPALAAHNGRLFIAWKGDGNDQLNVAAVNLDGAGSPTGFSSKVVLGDTSPLSPSLASAGGALYLAWRGDGNDNLNVMVSTDNGATFGHKLVSAETSSQAPVLGTFKGALMIGWSGDGNDHLNVARVATNPAPTGLAGKVTLGDTSPRSPALCEFDGRLYIAWKGDGNDHLNLMSSTDGQTFADKTISPETSPEAPSLAVDNGVLYIGWKGDGNDNLNVAPSVALLAPSYVWQTNIQNFPVSPGDVVNCSVQYIGTTAGQITFANQTNGKYTTVTLQPPPGASFDGNSADWIMEAPDTGEPVSSMPSFTTFSFTTAVACSATGSGNPKNGDTFSVVRPASGSTPAKTLTSTALSDFAVQISFTG
jgi:hypothetical protein